MTYRPMSECSWRYISLHFSAYQCTHLFQEIDGRYKQVVNGISTVVDEHVEQALQSDDVTQPVGEVAPIHRGVPRLPDHHQHVVEYRALHPHPLVGNLQLVDEALQLRRKGLVRQLQVVSVFDLIESVGEAERVLGTERRPSGSVVLVGGRWARAAAAVGVFLQTGVAFRAELEVQWQFIVVLVAIFGIVL